MNKTAFLLWPAIAVLVVSMFFIGVYVAPQKTQLKNVEAANNSIYFSISNTDYISGYLYEDYDYENPDYCSKVMVVIKGLNNAVIATNIFNLSGDISATTFSVTGNFSANTYYKLETAVPTFAEFSIAEFHNKDFGVFKYTTNKTFQFSYRIIEDRWFSGMATI